MKPQQIYRSSVNSARRIRGISAVKRWTANVTKWFAGLMVSLVSCSTFAFSPDTWSPGPGWTLLWADEFSSASIDPGNWGYDLGGGGWGNSELETYTSTNA